MTTPSLKQTPLTVGQTGKETTVNSNALRIEHATQRTLSVSFSGGDVTLTEDQFTSNFVFVCTGLTADRTLTIPNEIDGNGANTAERFFAIDNISGFDVTVTQGAVTSIVGSTSGVSLYADGTDVFNISSGSVIPAVKIGSIIDWPEGTAPSDTLECDGASYSTTTYAALFAIIGYTYGGSGANFNVPDRRGEFIRGFDNTAGNDGDAAGRTDRGDGTTGDAVGTKQSWAIENFVGTINGYGNRAYINSATGVFAEKAATTIIVDPGLAGNDSHSFDIDASRDIQTSTTQTRPRNVGTMYCIVYQ